VLLAVGMCLSLLAGCSGLKALENYVTLVLNVNGEIYATYDISIFNNAVVTEPKAPEGEKLYGWTPQKNWKELSQDEIVVTQNNTFITYNDVKDFIEGESQSVTLYAVFAVIPPKDLVVAWYRAEGVSTQTGLNEENMSAFTEDMYTYLRSKDYVPEEMDIVVRPYDGNVGNSCGGIMADGDVDIMVGWASNIGTTGGITFLENKEGVTIGSISRYAARLTNTYLSRLTYVWILNTYGEYNLPEPDPNEPDIPDEPDEPDLPDEPTLPTYTIDSNEQFTLVVAWYAKSDTSGIVQADMDAFVAALKTDLGKMGFVPANVTITTRGYEGTVEPSCGQIMADGDVNLMVGWGSNIDTKGKMTQGVDYLENVDGVKIGSISRYAANITDNFLTNVVFAWVRNTYGAGGAEYPTQPSVEPDPAGNVKLVVGWYSKSGTSGVTAEMMTNFETKLKAYLTSQGYDLSKVDLDIRDLGAGNVASVQDAVTAAGDVDLVLGMKAFELAEGVIKDVQENVVFGEKTDRRIHLLSDSEVSKLVFEWLKTDDARSVFQVTA